jgi:eukaryotic-like serine/threonine-protein kinase
LLVAGHTLADRFELRRRLGAGGMGEVFEAVDRLRGEVVALKTLTRADGDTLTRFKREFRALQSTSHPNLVALHELVRDGDRWFFTMEMVDGVHFLEHVRVGRAITGGMPRCDEARLRATLRQLVHGLRALHAAGLIHRDVKPSNVVVQPDGRAVLLDFGLVTELDPARQSVGGQPIGTVEYMAPEQAVGRAVTEAADWYGLGVMLYEALTGQVPHGGHVLQILIDKQQVEPIGPEQLAPAAPPDLAALCRDLLRIEPAARPTGAEVARRLGLDDVTARITATTMSLGSSVFVGRERELAALAASFERARDRPLVHLVVGESGIGKSELVRRFTGTLTSADPQLLLLHGRCYERESVPYKALDGVADGLAHHLARQPAAEVAAMMPAKPVYLARLFPVFQRIEAIASAPVAPRDLAGEPHEQRRRMFGALRSLVAALCESRPVVATIDDLQWADADSFLLLRELLRGAGAPRLLILATARDEIDVAAHLGGVVVERTEVGPLSPDESRLLAERLAPRVAARLDLGQIAREASGHPMFLRELVRHLETGDLVAPTATLDDALWSRVELLRSDARALVEAVCVAGAPISLEVATHACRLDATAVSRAAASLRVASLAREVQRGRGLAVEPFHDRVREAVTRRLDASTRLDLHARLAAALEVSTEPRDPQLLLRHFTLAGLPERAARYAEDAAQRSLDAHAFDQAAGLWRTALDLVPRDDADRRRLLLRLGEALVHAGHGAEAAEVYLAAAEGADPQSRLECHRNAAEQLLISGRIARGIEALDEVLAEIGVAVPATPRRALMSLLRNRLRLRLRGLGFRERHRREIADAELLRVEILRVAAHGLAMVDSIRGADFQTRELLEALATGHRPSIARGLILEGMFQATSSNMKRADALVRRALEVAGDQRDAYIDGLALGARGLIAYFGGEASTAVERLSGAEAVMRQIAGNTWEFNTTRLFLIYAMRFVGDYAEMRRHYDDYLADAQQRGDRYVDSTMRRVCVPMWLAADDPAEAARELARATWVPDTTAFHVQHFHELIALGEIALYDARPPDEARIRDGQDRLERSMLLRITSIRVQWDYLRGRLALAGWGGARVAARHARSLARHPSGAARVWANLLRGGAAAIRGDQVRAIAALEAAADQATAIGMRLSAAVARRRLAELRGGDHDAAVATAAEMAALGVRAPDRIARLLLPMPSTRPA